MKAFNPVILICALIVAAAPRPALAADKAGELLFRQGNGRGLAPCAPCHGEKGEGRWKEGFPQLAGLSPVYFSQQMANFRSGVRANPVMQPMAQQMSEAEQDQIASYVASLTPAPLSGAEPPTDGLGEQIAHVGLWKKGIPACFSCHGPDGLGVEPKFPRIVWQPPAYTLAQLTSWQSGARRGDPHDLMQGIAARLSEEERQSVAAYLASPTPGLARPRPAAPQKVPGPVLVFEAPDERDIPDSAFGRLVRRGRDIFINTPKELPEAVGNALSCANCHLDRGRLAYSAPLWGAYPVYPLYRSKTHQVDTIEERIQGCFRYSMNGKPPVWNSEPMKALVSYHFWLSRGAPTGVALPGRGYPELPKPARSPTYEAGEKLYATHCALCHGAQGEGQRVRGTLVFPPLWGPDSYNWGAGMHRINTAASFIKHNMPLSQGHTLSDEDAWNLAYFVNAHERPQDPRFQKSLDATTKEFHDENCLYGREVNGKQLGNPRFVQGARSPKHSGPRQAL